MAKSAPRKVVAMEVFWDLVHTMILFDAVAFVVVFAVGVLVAPVIVLMDGAFWWKRRLRWTAVAFFGSWFGLWMYWRMRPGSATQPSMGTTFDTQ